MMASLWERTVGRAKKAATPAPSTDTEEKQTIQFYGRELTVFRAPLAMEPDQERQMVTEVDSVIMHCQAPVLKRGQSELEPCGQPIQMYSNFRPVAYMCPWCFSVYLFAAPGSEPNDSDGELTLSSKDRMFCYGTYPGHGAQQSLAETIRQETAGNGLLVAHPMNPEGFFVPVGQVFAAPAAVPESDLRQLEHTPAAIVRNVLERGNDYYQRGDFWMAVALGERAAVVDPQVALSYTLIADALDELGQVEAALANYRKSVSLDPLHAMTQNNLGTLEMKMGRPDAAEASFRRALALQPGMPEASSGLGQLMVMAAYYYEGIQLLEWVVRAQSERLEPTYMLAVAYYQTGQLQRALAKLNDCDRIAPRDGDVHHLRGEVYLKLGRRQEAIPLLRRAASLGSQHAVNRLREMGLY